MSKETTKTLVNRAREIARAATSGCPLMDGRTKAEPDDFVGDNLTIEDAYPMTGKNRYFCVTVKEDKEIFFLSGGGLTTALENIYTAFDENIEDFRAGVNGLVFKFDKKRKTKNGHDFRPVTFE